jgi:HEAT repeat protein
MPDAMGVDAVEPSALDLDAACRALVSELALDAPVAVGFGPLRHRETARDAVELFLGVVEALPERLRAAVIGGLVDSRDHVVRTLAAERWVRQGHPDGLQVLRRSAAEERPADEQLAAGHALARRGDALGVRVLRGLLEYSWEPPRARYYLEYASDFARGQLVSVLDRASWPSERRRVQGRLATWRVRNRAAELLLDVGDDSAMAFLEGELRDPQGDQEAASVLLARRGATHAVTWLAERLEREPNRNDRARAAHLLGAVRARGVSQALVRALADPEWTVRRAAAKALGKLGDEACVPPLGEVLGRTREETEVRVAAACSLVSLGDRSAVDFLLTTARLAGSPSEGEMAVETLGEAGTPEAIESLRLLFVDGPTHLRHRVLEWLLERRCGEYVGVALDVLRGARPDIAVQDLPARPRGVPREKLLMAAASCALPADAASIAALLGDPVRSVRVFAAYAVIAIAARRLQSSAPTVAPDGSI